VLQGRTDLDRTIRTGFAEALSFFAAATKTGHVPVFLWLLF
jgi:hypothetical protein